MMFTLITSVITIMTMQNYRCFIMQSNFNDVRDFPCILRNKFVPCMMYNVVTCDVNLLSKPRVVLVRWTIDTSDFSFRCI